MNNPYKTYVPPAGEGGLYLRLEDGKEVIIRIASEPYTLMDSYTDKITGETTYSNKYAWVIYNFNDKMAQVMKLPVTAYRQIATIAADDEWGNPTEYSMKIKRTGKALDTKYEIVPSPNKTPLTVEQKAEVDKITLLEVKGFEHSIPLSQVVEGEGIPKPTVKDAVDIMGGTVIDEPPRKDEDAPISLDEIPF